MEVFAQIIGIAAGIVLMFSFQFRSNRMVFLFQMVSATLFAVNMLMLGALGGFLLNACGAIRGVFLALPKGKGINKWTLAAILILTVGVYSWQFAIGEMTRFVDFLLPFQFMFGTVLCWRQDGRLLRIGQLFVMSPFCLVYNICFGLLGGIMAECFNILSIIVSIIRYGWNGFERAGSPKLSDQSSEEKK